MTRTARLELPFLGAAGLGLLAVAVGAFVAPVHVLHAHLTAFATVLTIVLGMLFFVMLQHVTDAGWSVVPRRWAELVLAALPVMALAFLPLLVFLPHLWHWADPSITAGDPLYAIKSPYLNVPFFVVRAVVYFAIWILLALRLRGGSLRQDETGEAALSFGMRRLSAPGLILFGLALSFASVDWLMSLDYHWFSTIFGVYVFAHAVLAALAVLNLCAVGLGRGALRGTVTADTLHDLGKLTFTFAVFWAYIAFSQWFLIWYGNIPEETGWMLARGHAPWLATIVAVVVGLFVVPFVVLMPAAAKRRPRILVAVSVVILVAHWLGMVWLVQPSLYPDGLPLHLVWIDAGALLLVGGVAGWWVIRRARGRALAPLHDPRRHEAAGHDLSGAAHG